MNNDYTADEGFVDFVSPSPFNHWPKKKKKKTKKKNPPKHSTLSSRRQLDVKIAHVNLGEWEHRRANMCDGRQLIWRMAEWQMEVRDLEELGGGTWEEEEEEEEVHRDGESRAWLKRDTWRIAIFRHRWEPTEMDMKTWRRNLRYVNDETFTD